MSHVKLLPDSERMHGENNVALTRFILQNDFFPSFGTYHSLSERGELLLLLDPHAAANSHNCR